MDGDGSATVALRTGANMPQVGLGVYQTPRGEVTRQAVAAALALGYRHVDTARIYGNEADVGAAIRSAIDAGEVERAEVFVTTKLWNDDHGFDPALRAFDRSLMMLGLEWVDLYLVHWPVAGKRADTWRALERVHREGRARAIGVSNYLAPHLVELMRTAEVVPAVDQIELSPFLQRRETRELCAAYGIQIAAYSPLTRGERLGHPIVGRIAAEVGRTPAQVLLRWGLDQGAVVLPKTSRPARLAENLAVFDFALTDAHRAALDGLEEGLATGWDPARQA